MPKSGAPQGSSLYKSLHPVSTAPPFDESRAAFEATVTTKMTIQRPEAGSENLACRPNLNTSCTSRRINSCLGRCAPQLRAIFRSPNDDDDDDDDKDEDKDDGDGDDSTWLRGS